MQIANFRRSIEKAVAKERIIDDLLLRYAYATDASVYRLLPQLVIIVRTVHEVQAIVSAANQYKIPLTFRAAGTSLSGQAQTNSVLVMLANDAWQDYTILNQGKQMRLACGIIASHANAMLKPYATKLGPDPASISACKIGGIVANNSSGMCCGVIHNTYHTLASIKALLANGFMFDSSDSQTHAQLQLQHPHIISKLESLRAHIINSPHLVAKIKSKFTIKNTSGYSLNAFLDFTQPVDILAHLLVGSEGTLGFISEVTYNTVADYAHKSVALIYMSTTAELVELATAFNHAAITAIELLDNSSLRAVRSLAGAEKYLPSDEISTHGAILVEVAASTATELVAIICELKRVLLRYHISHLIDFTTDAQVIEELWQLRKSIFPLIGANRDTETSVIIEDIAVAQNKLPPVVNDISDLLLKYGYTNYAIFGHVLAGNIHFVFTPNLTQPSAVTMYDNFMREVTQLVVSKYDGSLKAEHGCGRNMAPFVELEWGSELYAIMQQVKQLLDPHNILNPDVILTSDKQLHIKHLKPMYHIEDDKANKCVECGFCEKVCPSKNLTLTPRQRIASYRYLQHLRNTVPKLWRKLSTSYQYLAIDTCATTGMCQSSCPVAINTGQLMLSLSKSGDTSIGLKLMSRYYALFMYLSNKFMHTLAKLNGLAHYNLVTRVSSYLHQLKKTIPVYLAPVKQYNEVIVNHDILPEAINKQLLYLPSCSSRVLEQNSAFQQLCTKLGIAFSTLTNANQHCCGQFFTSRNAPHLAKNKNAELASKVNAVNYAYIVMDNSSCCHTLKNNSATNWANLYSEVDFIWQYLSEHGDKIQFKHKFAQVVLHIDCASQKLANNAKIMHILSYCATKVITLNEIVCCGFAGTKGYTVPELNAAMLSGLSAHVAECDCGVTLNANCAIGLTHHSQIPYYTLSQLLLRCL